MLEVFDLKIFSVQGVLTGPDSGLKEQHFFRSELHSFTCFSSRIRPRLDALKIPGSLDSRLVEGCLS